MQGVEEEVDWKQAYMELKREREQVLMPLLRSALKFVPEDEGEDVESSASSSSDTYEDKIAPRDADLPAIMTMCSPEERKKLAVKVRAKILDGKWTGLFTGRKDKQGEWMRPTITMATERSKEEQEAGLRKKTRNFKDPNGKTGQRKSSPRVTFFAYHVVLVDAGYYPTEKKNICSHICHWSRCVDLNHILWSSSDENSRRERLCRRAKQCRCGLKPACDFALHPDELN